MWYRWSLGGSEIAWLMGTSSPCVLVVVFAAWVAIVSHQNYRKLKVAGGSLSAVQALYLHYRFQAVLIHIKKKSAVPCVFGGRSLTNCRVQ
jgi:hypothetical protein